MTTSRIDPSKWMYTDGNAAVGTEDIIKTARGWVKVHPNGQEELIHALTTMGDAAPAIASVSNYADGTYDDQEAMSFDVVFGEAVTVVTSGGTPVLKVYTAAGTTFDIPYASGSTTDTLTFSCSAGDLTGIADGTFVVMTQVFLEGGTIKDSADQDIDVRFPADYAQPTIAILGPYIDSVANHADGTQADTDPISMTLTFSEAMTVVEAGGTPGIYVYTDDILDQYLLEYASGSTTTDLVFTGTPTGMGAGSLVIVEQVDLLGGTIKNAAGSEATLTFPGDYAQPAITITNA